MKSTNVIEMFRGEEITLDDLFVTEAPTPVALQVTGPSRNRRAWTADEDAMLDTAGLLACPAGVVGTTVTRLVTAGHPLTTQRSAYAIGKRVSELRGNTTGHTRKPTVATMRAQAADLEATATKDKAAADQAQAQFDAAKAALDEAKAKALASRALADKHKAAADKLQRAAELAAEALRLRAEAYAD